MVKKIFAYIGKFIANPAKAAEEIAKDEQGLWAGFWWVMISGFLYSITVLICYLLGHKPITTPFLTIPPEKWYLVQTFTTTIPVALAGSLSYGALAFILGKAFKGKGTFEATFASQAYTIYIPTIIFYVDTRNLAGTHPYCQRDVRSPLAPVGGESPCIRNSIYLDISDVDYSFK